MRSVALLPASAILAGACAGIVWARPMPLAAPTLVVLWLVAVVGWWRQAALLVVAVVPLVAALAGAALGASAAREALMPELRQALDAAFGGFSFGGPDPTEAHPPVLTRARLLDDAAVRDFGVQLRARVEEVQIEGKWHRAGGGVRITVSGDSAAPLAAAWRRGRGIEAPATFRRPARYLNEGVPDFERDLALSGVTLNASVKSGLLVRVVANGTWFDEIAADIRVCVRRAVRRYVSTRNETAGAIVTAILIGDRSALPDEVRERLQAAGTYHVIAISGGNIAILAAILSIGLFALGSGPRLSALIVIAGLVAYAGVVSAGPSVWRATLTAIVYLAARLFDHRSPPWNAMAVSAALLACIAPLDVADTGFALTFGATAAILETVRRAADRSAGTSWLLTSAAASLAVEIVLLPIGATAFSRATVAGIVLNLIAVPLMTVTQVGGLAVVLVEPMESIASAAGTIAALAAGGLVESARLVDAFPWLALRVPPPAPALVVTYYAALACSLWLPRAGSAARFALLACIVAILAGVSSSAGRSAPPSGVRLTMFDVGQGDALLLQARGGMTLMIDAGGVGFDGAAFDIGGRVLAPALWARGVRRFDALAITHGDPDHVGGAPALIRDFTPAQVWQGILVPGHPASAVLAAAAERESAALAARQAGWVTELRGTRLRVLHPPPADWERFRVRNDDSIVIEVVYGDVAMLLTGDIGAAVEQTLIPMLTPARTRILKVAHHGSRTSTGQAFVDAWRPSIALISCGRGNRFGHPVPEVIQRLQGVGAEIYRTDRDGQITVDTDGKAVSVRTLVNRF